MEVGRQADGRNNDKDLETELDGQWFLVVVSNAKPVESKLS